MSEPITLYRVFLATPSDVSEELTIVNGLLQDWNLQHGQALGVRLELVNWRTHTRPLSVNALRRWLTNRLSTLATWLSLFSGLVSEHRPAGRARARKKRSAAESNKAKKYWSISPIALRRDRNRWSILVSKNSSGSLGRRRYFGHTAQRLRLKKRCVIT